MKDLIKQNYEITKARGLITDQTTDIDFNLKLQEELIEVYMSRYPKELHLEIADVILVCFNYLHHSDIDIEILLKEKIEINRKRIQ